MLNLFAWTLSFVLMIVAIGAIYPLQQTDSKAIPLAFGLYDALSRVAWSIALCYIIFACIHNYGGPVNWFLSHPLWQPLSRLTFSIYLLHKVIINLSIAAMKRPIYFSEFSAVWELFELNNYSVDKYFCICRSTVLLDTLC